VAVAGRDNDSGDEMLPQAYPDERSCRGEINGEADMQEIGKQSLIMELVGIILVLIS
jgi:hypothetical protein